MISPQDIRERARRLWSSGGPLRAALIASEAASGGAGAMGPPPVKTSREAAVAEDAEAFAPEAGSFFPCPIPFRKPTAQEWLDRFASLREAVARLHAESKAVCGAGYAIRYREVAHQKLGRLTIPERIEFESIEDLAECANETEALHRFIEMARRVRTQAPRMLNWMAERPLAALASADLLPQLLGIAAYFQTHPRPNRFARELGIAGVDSKFMENHRAVVSMWLDCLLPAQAIDEAVRGLASHGFERRYGLRFEEPSIRVRWLDPARRLAGFSDVVVPVSELAAHAPECDRFIVTENKVNFLSLPASAHTLAIFGGGYGIELLRALPWLATRPLYYWGDIDTHGFGILSRLRQHVAHARSFLMDRETLMSHRELWTEELSVTRVVEDLAGLDPDERSLYDDLRHNRLGDRVRLEQERVSYPLVEQTIAVLSASVRSNV
ncbi:Wadjet anti-phage system protein JetD domain-containing protein [Steroidobacter flavus]|uniref:Wadjet anti-phage system protein JetD domain-containing protein n=1 Tax=Steroidobacter flavus TaxID=1842136 RepID=A0ABV8SZG2_9GAMM